MFLLCDVSTLNAIVLFRYVLTVRRTAFAKKKKKGSATVVYRLSLNSRFIIHRYVFIVQPSWVGRRTDTELPVLYMHTTSGCHMIRKSSPSLDVVITHSGPCFRGISKRRGLSYSESGKNTCRKIYSGWRGDGRGDSDIKTRKLTKPTRLS